MHKQIIIVYNLTSSGGLEGFPLSAGKGGGLTNRNRVFFPDEDEMKAAMRGIAANPGIGRTGVDAPFASAKYKLDRGRWQSRGTAYYRGGEWGRRWVGGWRAARQRGSH